MEKKREKSPTHLFLLWKSLSHSLNILLSRIIDEERRIHAIDLLARWQGHVPCSILLFTLTDVSWKVRTAAAQALGSRRQSFPVQAMLQAFAQEQDMTVREAIVNACVQHAKRIPVIWFTMVLSDDPVWLVREAAAKALSSWGPQMPLLPLFRTVRWDEDEQVRAAAAKTLGQSQCRQAKNVLLTVCETDPHEDVVRAATLALQCLHSHDSETRNKQ